jgi:site-specific DNA-methyltransferase (adenine-specific)
MDVGEGVGIERAVVDLIPGAGFAEVEARAEFAEATQMWLSFAEAGDGEHTVEIDDLGAGADPPGGAAVGEGLCRERGRAQVDDFGVAEGEARRLGLEGHGKVCDDDGQGFTHGADAGVFTPLCYKGDKAHNEDSQGDETMARLALVPNPVPVQARPGEPEWMTALRFTETELWARVRQHGEQRREHFSDRATYILGDTIKWLSDLPPNSIHAIVTDPPYGLVEYDEKNHKKLRAGRGGVWRIPPSFDGAKRNPLPRFTVLSTGEITALHSFFSALAYGMLRILVPGGHVFIASNPLLSTMTFHALQEAGFEKRGEIIRLVQTFRGGDKPKGAEEEFSDVSVMPRSCWEPWGIFRKSCIGTVADNLRAWGTGGLRRASREEPLKDIIQCSPTRGEEKKIAPHPSLKPQRFLRQVVRAALPLGIGIIYDPFAGSGSTLAAAEVLGFHSIGTDRDPEYFGMARTAFPQLAALVVQGRNER